MRLPRLLLVFLLCCLPVLMGFRSSTPYKPSPEIILAQCLYRPPSDSAPLSQAEYYLEEYRYIRHQRDFANLSLNKTFSELMAALREPLPSTREGIEDIGFVLDWKTLYNVAASGTAENITLKDGRVIEYAEVTIWHIPTAPPSHLRIEFFDVENPPTLQEVQAALGPLTFVREDASPKKTYYVGEWGNEISITHHRGHVTWIEFYYSQPYLPKYIFEIRRNRPLTPLSLSFEQFFPFKEFRRRGRVLTGICKDYWNGVIGYDELRDDFMCQWAGVPPNHPHKE